MEFVYHNGKICIVTAENCKINNKKCKINKATWTGCTQMGKMGQRGEMNQFGRRTIIQVEGDN